MALSTKSFYSDDTSEHYFSRRTSLTPRGLKNAGNTCYVNSAIQTLFSFNFFMDKLKRYYETFSRHILAKEKEDSDDFPILSRLIKLFDTYKNSRSNIDLNDYLMDFKTFFGSKCDQRYQTHFKDKYVQQDAAEFLSFVLQFIEEEINNNKSTYEFNKISPVDQHFQYTLVIQEKCCQCGQIIKKTSECTNTFHLELTPDRTLQSAFMKQIDKEELPNKCSNCSGTVIVEKTFEKLPEVLIFQSARYNDSFKKDLENIYANGVIFIPRSYIQELGAEKVPPSLPPLCKPNLKRSVRLKEIANKKLKSSDRQKTNGELKENTPNNLKSTIDKSTSGPLSNSQRVNCGVVSIDRPNCVRYQLMSIICHYGLNTTAGHYKSFVYKNSKWFLCNDDSVEEVDFEKLFADVSTKGLGYYYVRKPESDQ